MSKGRAAIRVPRLSHKAIFNSGADRAARWPLTRERYLVRLITLAF